MIIPNTNAAFTGKISTLDATNYPYGKARNVTTPGDGLGTPLIDVQYNDLLGFFAAVAVAAGFTPSGDPETAVVSQVLDGVRTVCKKDGKQQLSTQTATTGSYASANHNAFVTCTNAAANTVTLNAPAAPYGDVVTFCKAAGAGDVTAVPGAGVGALLLVTGVTAVLNVNNQVMTCVSVAANTWRIMK